MMDIDVRFFRDDLVNFINSNPLPVEVKRLVLKEVIGAVEETADKIIEQQRQIQPTMESKTVVQDCNNTAEEASESNEEPDEK